MEWGDYTCGRAGRNVHDGLRLLIDGNDEVVADDEGGQK